MNEDGSPHDASGGTSSRHEREGNNTRRGRGERNRGVGNRNFFNNWNFQRRANATSDINLSDTSGAGSDRLSNTGIRQLSNNLSTNMVVSEASGTSSGSNQPRGRVSDSNRMSSPERNRQSNTRLRFRRRQQDTGDSSRPDRGNNSSVNHTTSPTRQHPARSRRGQRGYQSLQSRRATDSRPNVAPDFSAPVGLLPSPLQLQPEPYIPPGLLFGDGSSENPFLLSPSSPDFDHDSPDLDNGSGLTDEDIARQLQQEEWEAASTHSHDDGQWNYLHPEADANGSRRPHWLHGSTRRRHQATLPSIPRLSRRGAGSTGLSSSSERDIDATRSLLDLMDILPAFIYPIGYRPRNEEERRSFVSNVLAQGGIGTSGILDRFLGNRYLGEHQGEDYEQLLAMTDEVGEVPRGLSNSEIKKIPTIKHKTEETLRTEAGEEETGQCNICLTDYNEGDKKRKLPCKHLFHLTCIDKWLKTNATCPVCRADIKELLSLA